MEIRPRQQVIPIAYGKRVIELRLSSRAECRALIAEIARASGQLPEDGEGALLLFADLPRRAPAADDDTWTEYKCTGCGAEYSALPYDVRDPHKCSPAAEPGMVFHEPPPLSRDLSGDLMAAPFPPAPFAPTEPALAAVETDDAAAADRAAYAAAAEPERCGATIYGPDSETSCVRPDGHVGSCSDEPAPFGEPGEEPDEAALLAAGERAADEVDEARSRERRSDSVVSGDDFTADPHHDPAVERAAGDDSERDREIAADDRAAPSDWSRCLDGVVPLTSVAVRPLDKQPTAAGVQIASVHQ